MFARKQNHTHGDQEGRRRRGNGCKERKGRGVGVREEGVRGGGNKRVGAGTGQCTLHNLGITVRRATAGKGLGLKGG